MRAAFTTINPFGVKDHKSIVFNASRPIAGDNIIANGEWVAGRYWAYCESNQNLCDVIQTNIKLDAVRVFTVNQSQIETLAKATIPEKYIDNYNTMDSSKQEAILKSYIDKLNRDMDESKALQLMLRVGML